MSNDAERSTIHPARIGSEYSPTAGYEFGDWIVLDPDTVFPPRTLLERVKRWWLKLRGKRPNGTWKITHVSATALDLERVG